VAQAFLPVPHRQECLCHLILQRTLSASFEKFRYVCRFRPGSFDHRVSARQIGLPSSKGEPSYTQMKGQNMRVMVLGKATKDTEAGVMPTQQQWEEMEQFNEELVKAGIVLAAEGLQPSSKGVRVHFSGKDRIVTDGPFTETKELVAGYSIWQVKSMEEAIAWVKRCPLTDSEVEVRPIFSYSPEEVSEIVSQAK
jgi:hypothetical protein